MVLDVDRCLERRNFRFERLEAVCVLRFRHRLAPFGRLDIV
jgi:hypothetical protein